MKPVTPLTPFAGLSPPWGLASLDNNFAALTASQNDLGTYSNPLLDISSVPNVIVATTAPGLTVNLAFGLLVYVKLNTTNTSIAVTLNLNGLGANGVVFPGNQAPGIGQLVAGATYGLLFDGVSLWQLVSPVSPWIRGSLTIDLPSINPGTLSVTFLSMPGAEIGDAVAVGASVSVSGLAPYAQVTSSGQVAVGFFNYGSSPVDPASCTFKVAIMK